MMNRAAHTNASIGLSMAAGCLFAIAAAMPDPTAIMFLPIPVIIGVMLGLLCAPAAVLARADMECRRSFLLAVLPTCVVSYGVSVVGGPGAAILATVATYVALCVTLWLLARRIRRRLNWYRSNRCTSCGYDMAGISASRCPECGNTARGRPPIRVSTRLLRP